MPTQNAPFPSALRQLLRRKLTWVIAIPVVLAMLAGGGVYGYVKYTSANVPPPLGFDALAPAPSPTMLTGAGTSPAASAAGTTSVAPSATTAPAAPSAGASPAAVAAPPQRAGAPTTRATAPTRAQGSEVEGRWLVNTRSLAGYRIGYSAVGVRGTRVGRTPAGSKAVTGEFLIKGTVLKSARFSIAMAQVECDGGQQCTDHVNEMMDVEHHPYETFVLTKAVDLKRIPADGKQITVDVTGTLTLRGVTRTVTFPLTGRRQAGRIEVLGSIPVNRDDYKIPDSSEPGFSIDKDGHIELLLAFDRA